MDHDRSQDSTLDALRYSGIDRLYGKGTWARLRAAHVAVVGLGGVGSWTAEALARSGVGTLTLVDLDDVCITNTNRQLHTLDATVGRPKIEVMAERLLAINPAICIHPVAAFVSTENVDAVLAGPFDGVVDAVDRMSIKAAIIARGVQQGWHTLTVGSSGGKRRAEAVQIVDLGATGRDELLKQVRRKLRRDHGWAKGEHLRYGVRAVFSTESLVFPQPDGSVCEVPAEGESLRMDCANGLGAACHVTGVFGFLAAGALLEMMLGLEPA